MNSAKERKIIKKCKGCKNQFNIEDLVYYKERYLYCRECFNPLMQKEKYRNKIQEYLCDKIGFPIMTSYIWKQVRELSEKLNHKQILYLFYYCYGVKKIYNPIYAYTIAKTFGYINPALEHAKNKNIDLIDIDEDYFEIEKDRMKAEEEKLKQEIIEEEKRKLEEKNRIKAEKLLEEEGKRKLKIKEIERLNAPATKFLEKDLEKYLINNLDVVEKGMKYIDNQVSVKNGIIDILARDKNDKLCILELKIDGDCKDLVFQCIYYPTQFEEECRMLAISTDYSDRIYTSLCEIENLEIYIADVELGTIKNPVKSAKIKRINK